MEDSKEKGKEILNYERIIFLSNDIKEKNTFLIKKAIALKEINEYERAAKTLERVQEFALNKEEKKEYYYQKILSYYLSENIENAVSTIENMYFSLDSIDVSQTLLLQVLVYNESRDYNKAREKSIQYLRFSNQMEKIPIIDSLYNNKPRLKNEKLAQVLSFIPGLGHCYAGYWTEGIVSFLLNGSVLAFGTHEFITKNYITAYLGAGGIFSGLYFGSYERALFLTKKRNYINTKAFNISIKEEIIK